jgi:alkylhydroperoxidase family enzyme
MPRIPDVLHTDDGTPIRHNLLRTLANNPEVAHLLEALARGVHEASHLPQRTRELVILKVALSLRADGEWARHFQIGLVVGVSVKEARAVREDDLSTFTPAERMAMLFAEAVDQCRVTADVWADTAQHYSDLQMLDLVLLAGLYGYTSRIGLAMDIAVDKGMPGIDQT